MYVIRTFDTFSNSKKESLGRKATFLAQFWTKNFFLSFLLKNCSFFALSCCLDLWYNVVCLNLAVEIVANWMLAVLCLIRMTVNLWNYRFRMFLFWFRKRSSEYCKTRLDWMVGCLTWSGVPDWSGFNKRISAVNTCRGWPKRWKPILDLFLSISSVVFVISLVSMSVVILFPLVYTYFFGCSTVMMKNKQFLCSMVSYLKIYVDHRDITQQYIPLKGLWLERQNEN